MSDILISGHRYIL